LWLLLSIWYTYLMVILSSYRVIWLLFWSISLTRFHDVHLLYS
jgi:hypothetical protein